MKTSPNPAATRSLMKMALRFRAAWAVGLLFLSTLPLVVQAQFDYTTDNGKVTITRYTGPGGEVIIPSRIDDFPVTSIGDFAFASSSVTTVEIPGGVTSIGYHAFVACNGLTGIMIPDSVTTISRYTFAGCSSLTNVTIPDKVTIIAEYVFDGCSSLTRVNFPESVTTIESGVFRGCASLTSVTIPDNVTSIGLTAFEGCNNLTEIKVGALNSFYSSQDGVLFDKGQAALILWPLGKAVSYDIPNGVTSIGDSAFSDCSRLTGITIPEGVTNIGTGAFFGCSSLTSLTIPESVTTIGTGAFYGCSSLTSVVIPDSVINMGPYVFVGCISLTTVTVGNNVTSIGQEVFGGCSSLVSVTIGSGVTSIGYMAFQGCHGLTSISIPDSVTFIADGAFSGLSGLTVVEIGSGVGCIGCGGMFSNEGAFSNCTNLASVTIHSNAVNIDFRSFLGCSRLTSVLIGNSVMIGNTGSRIGEEAFFGCSSLTSVTIPESVNSIGNRAFDACTQLLAITVEALNADYSSRDGVLFDKNQTTLIRCPQAKFGSYTIPNSVTRIWYNAFAGCTKLTSVTIPESVTEIGESAFSGCSSLTSVTIPASVTGGYQAFLGCTGLTSVTLQQGLTSIGFFMFSGCTGLTSVTIPDSVIGMGGGAFSDCTGLTSVTIQHGPTTIGAGMFSGCTGLTSVTIPDSVTSIEFTAFWRCSSLTSINIPDGVTSIGYSAFSGCSSLTSINIPDGITSIATGAFSGCSSLTSVTIGNGVTSVDGEAFSGCSALTSVTIPNSVTSIGGGVFSGCNNLSAINVDTLNSVYSSQDGVLFDKGQSTLIQFPEGKAGSYTIPASVTSIVGWPFSGCNNLSAINVDTLNSVYSSHEGVLLDKGRSTLIRCPAGKAGSYTIPASVTTIGDSAFSGCSSLTSVLIGDNVVRVGEWAFQGCSSLISVTISASVTSVGYQAFLGCTGLTSVTLQQGLTTIGAGMFSGCTGLTRVTIPDSVISMGEAAFSDCTGLTSVILPQGLNTVAKGMFSGCTGLTSVAIPDSVTSIGFGAFSNCKSLTSVTIGNGVTSVLTWAFSGCSSLAAAYFHGNAPIVFQEAFLDADSVIIYYLPGTTGWGPAFGGRPTALWVNHPPEFALVANREVVEGDVLDVVLSVSDSDVGQVLTYALLAGPPGLVLEAQAGRLTWSTGEGDGPSEHTVIVSVTDDGYPQLSATNSFVVRVLETNSPPQLESIPDVSVLGGQLLRFVASATDGDRPVNALRYTLAPGAPVGVTLDPITGEFVWTPGESDGPSTHELAIVVTDDGLPPLSDSRPFQIFVLAGPVNEPPVLTLPAGDQPLAYVENAGPRLLDLDARVTDEDSPDFGGGSLRVEFASGGAAEDRLAIRDEGAGATNITLVAEQRVHYGGVEIGTFEGGTNGTAPLRVTFNGSATVAAVERLVRNVTYENVSESPSSAPRSLRLSLEDGDGGTSVPVVRAVEVTPVNDPPVALPDSAATSLNQAVIIDVTQLTANDSDVDSTNLTLDLPKTASAQGGTVALTDGRVVYQPPDAFLGEDVFEYRLQDDQGDWATGRVTVLVQAQFDYTTDNGKVTITRYTGAGGEVTIPDTMEGLPVTSIGVGAFEQSSLTSVTIGNNVTTIGVGAFDNCTSLTSVTIPDSVTSIGFAAFISCSSLTNVTIGNNVTSIEGRTFSYCGSLTRVTIGNSVISIGEWAFSFCSLTSVTIPDSVTSIGHYAFTGCSSLTNVTIGKSVASIGEEAFSGCSSLTSVTIPDSVTSIGYGHMVFGDPPGGSFSGCTSLTSVTIGNSVTGIGVYAFYGCSSLTNVTIGKSVASIADEAFSGCSSLTSITIPDSVTSIGFGGVVWGNRIGGSFSGCNHLTAFTVGTLNPVYSSRQGVLFDKSQTALLQCPPGKAGSYTIPNGVTRIGDSAFSPCSNLTSVTIPDSVTSIGPWAFSGCQRLTAAYFKGNAPSFMECGWPNECPPFTSDLVIIYYLSGTSGWGSTFSGRPTALWVNHPPEFGPMPDREMVEGDVLDLVLSVTDSDAGQVLTYALLSAPPGLVLDAQAGRLTWSTGEGDGPSEHTVTVSVTDDGYPPLSATNSFVVRVLETNAPPKLEAIPDVSVLGGQLLRFVASATDGDRPANTLRYTLAPGAPVGVTLDPITGEFLWTPGESDGPSTNELAIVVTDNGLPPLSDSRPFQIIVLAGPVNEPPVLTLPAGDQPLAYVENDRPRILDLDARVTDKDSPDFDGGSLRVEFASGGAAEDRLAIRDEGAGATNITLVAEQRVQYGGVEIGTFEGGTNGTAPLRVTFNGSATVAAVERLVRNVTYENVSESPSSAPRSLRLSLEDGDGGTSVPVVRAIEVTPVNDPPVALPDSAATSLNQAVIIDVTKLTANDSDVDSTNLTLDLPTTASAQGGIVALTDGRVVYQPPDAFLGEDVFEYRLQDEQGGSATGQVTVLVRPTGGQLNIASITILEDGSVRLVIAGVAGWTYSVESSPDLVVWTELGSVTVGPDGFQNFTDPEADGQGQKFYRIVGNL